MSKLANPARSVARGFSFIEILVAVAIMGVMIGTVVGVFQYLARSKRTATEAVLKSIQGNLETYNSDMGKYPASLEDLITKPADAKLWRGPYQDKEYRDGWKHSLVYQVNPKGSPKPYQLYSWGPNGEGAPAEEQISVWDI